MKNNRAKNIFITLFFMLLSPVVIWLLLSYPYKFFSHVDTSHVNNRLTELAKMAIPYKDLPASAILYYKGEIIGEGFNTELRDSNIAGHAEINAITNCVQKIGLKAFQRLNRKDLVLITTFEPCVMCRGAISANNIDHVVFSLPKKFSQKVESFQKEVKYNYGLKENGNGRLQYDLFKLHPDFDSLQYRY